MHAHTTTCLRLCASIPHLLIYLRANGLAWLLPYSLVGPLALAAHHDEGLGWGVRWSCVVCCTAFMPTRLLWVISALQIVVLWSPACFACQKRWTGKGGKAKCSVLHWLGFVVSSD